jgi:hypothetical protein
MGSVDCTSKMFILLNEPCKECEQWAINHE